MEYYSSDAQKIVIVQGARTNTFAFDAGTGYLYAASSSSNYLRTNGSINDNSSWKITIDDTGAANIVAQGTNTRNLLRYHASAKLFSCYSTGQKLVKIYAKSPLPTFITSAHDESEKLKIYNLVGRMINVESLDELPAGVYIVNNKKVLVR